MNTVSCLAFATRMQGNFLVMSCTVIKYHEFVPSAELGSGLYSQFTDFELDSG